MCFRIRRNSMKFNAVMVQRTLKNRIITLLLSIQSGSLPVLKHSIHVDNYSGKYNKNGLLVLSFEFRGTATGNGRKCTKTFARRYNRRIDAKVLHRSSSAR